MSKQAKTFHWVVPSANPQKGSESGKKLESLPFIVMIGEDQTVWNLKCYPNGSREPGYISLNLYLKSAKNTNFIIRFKLGIVAKNGDVVRAKSFERSGSEFKNDKGYHGWGNPKLISHESLSRHSELLINDTLTVVCEICVQAPSILLINPVMSLSDTSDDFSVFLENGTFCDLELKLNDGSFMVHKVILAVRSPAFLDLLLNGKSTDMVELSNFGRKDLEPFLKFIYSNKVDNLADNALDLIIDAHKLKIDGLKNLCVKQIEANLSVENVLETLMVVSGVKYLQPLRRACLDLIFRQYEILSTCTKWKTLSKELALVIIDDMMKYRKNEIIHI